jgi:hypothetical protein
VHLHWCDGVFGLAIFGADGSCVALKRAAILVVPHRDGDRFHFDQRDLLRITSEGNDR